MRQVPRLSHGLLAGALAGTPTKKYRIATSWTRYRRDGACKTSGGAPHSYRECLAADLGPMTVCAPTRACARGQAVRPPPMASAGQLSIKELPRQHGLSDTAIRKRAKANGWTPDLSGAVRSRVRESLVREGVRANLLAGVTPSEAAIVDAAGGMRAKEKGWTQRRALLSPEDIDDIAAGAIHSKTLHAYAQSFVEGIRSGRIAALPERKGAKPAPLWGSAPSPRPRLRPRARAVSWCGRGRSPGA
jgi:hypothetical protein